jgi:2Fe-2S ferredoxin
LPKVVFLLPDGARRMADVPTGATVLEAARAADVAIEGACGGQMACATCHVHVDAAWWARLAAASAEEEDMLDLAREPAATSRLGCQLRLGAATDGLVVAVPASSLLG